MTVAVTARPRDHIDVTESAVTALAQGSKSCRIRSAVEQNVLTGDVRGMDAAQKGTGLAEFCGSAETLGGNLSHGLRRQG
jgi:hypothetical protein